jgi:cation transport regulator
MDTIRYEKIEDLPEPLKNALPKEAQEIYLAAYQENWQDYEIQEGGEMGREGVAHRDAMQTVMQEYRLDQESGKWYRRDKEIEADEDSASLLEEALSFFENLVPNKNQDHDLTQHDT